MSKLPIMLKRSISWSALNEKQNIPNLYLIIINKCALKKNIKKHALFFLWI